MRFTFRLWSTPVFGVFLGALLLMGWHLSPALAGDTASTPTALSNDSTFPDSKARQEIPAAPLEEIVVTGSHLSSPSLQYASPISVLSPDEIRAGGATSIDAALTALPEVVASQNQFSGDGVGLSTVNLRGLGTSRTLVLVDGRRYIAADATQVVDLNTIPDALVERVDVVTGGRSAVYGSDALAGVVNFILKKDFAGLETTVHYGETEYRDGGDLRVGATFGVNSEDQRGNLTLFGEFATREAVLSRNRAYAATALQDNGSGQLIPGGTAWTEGGLLLGQGGGPPMAFLPGGTLVPWDGALYNFNPNLDLQVPSHRRIVGALANYKIAPSLTAYAEAEFVDVYSATSGPPNGPYADPVTLQVASPFFPASTQAYLSQFDPTNSGYVNAALSRASAEFGNQSFDYDRQAIRTVLGLRGGMAAGWRFDAYYNYASSHGFLRQENSLSQSRLQAALDTAFLNPTTGAISPFPFAGIAGGGQLVCASALAQAQGCVPANMFGVGRLSAAAIAYLAEQLTQNETAITQVANLTFTNDEIARLPTGGAVAMDAGLEWRRQSADFRPDQATIAGDAFLTKAGPISGSYDVKEAFVEMNADLISNRGWAQLLSVNAAARESDYSISTTGKVLSWSAGMIYQPVEAITFRTQYQRATRAPNINDLYGAPSQVAVPGTDPCNKAVPGTTLAARCIATGVPASLIGTVINPNDQITDQQGGSTHLQAEVSNTWTTGLVYRPGFARDASVTLDYYRINVSQYITAIGATNIVDLCYGLGLSSYCSRISRFPNGGVIHYVDDTSANSGGFKTSGVDLGLHWQSTFASQNVPALSGTLSATGHVTYQIDRTLTPVSEIPQQVNACAGRFGVLCGNPSPKWKAISTVSWKHGPFGLTGQWQFIGPVSDDGGLGSGLAVEHVSGVSYFNLNASYGFAPGADVTLGVVNLLNRLPPVMGNNSDANWANSWPATYDTIGRRFFLEARYTF